MTTYRVRLINGEYIDVQADSPQDAAEHVVRSVEILLVKSDNN